LQILKFCICWQFCIQVLALVCMSPVLRNSIWFHFHCLITCFYHYGIGEYSTVHFSVTLQSKFWVTRSRIWLFVDNFGAWKKCNLGPWKVLEFCTLSLLRTLHSVTSGCLQCRKLKFSSTTFTTFISQKPCCVFCWNLYSWC